MNHSFVVSLCRLHHKHTIVTYPPLAVLEMKIWIYWSKSHYLIDFYILLNKNWKFYWSEQSCTGLWLEDRCLLWGLTSICAVKLHGLNNFLLYTVFVQDIVFSGNWSVRDWNSISVVMLEDTIENDCNFYSFLTIQQLFQTFWNKRHTLSVNIGTYSKTSQNNLFFYLFNTCTNKLYIFVQCTYTVDSRLELGWLEFPVESNFYRSPELRCV